MAEKGIFLIKVKKIESKHFNQMLLHLMSCPRRHHGCVVFVFIEPLLICRRFTVSDLLLFFAGLQPQT